jgi:hypothetical protein
VTREEAIKYAEDKLGKGLYRLELGYLNRGLYQIVAREVDFMRVAISALRAQGATDTNAGHKTNADHIRSMTDEELAALLARETFRIAKPCFDAFGYGLEEQVIYAKRLVWLKQPYGGDT